MRRRRTVLLAVAALCMVLSGTAGYVYRHPPLSVNGIMQGTWDGTHELALDLVNDGPWTVSLTDVLEVETGHSLQHAVAVVSFSAEMAGSAAMHLESTQNAHSGPIRGWKVEPTHWGEPRPTHAIRLTRDAQEQPLRGVVIRYRYLGLPLTLTVPLAD